MWFAPDYFAARERFRERSLRLGLAVESQPIEALGPEGQQLTLDIASSGPPDSDSVLVFSSGLHGVEGFLGSAVQCAVLDRWDSIRPRSERIRCHFLHALNPFGFAALRRCDEHNVDSNRNFLLPTESFRGCHPAYARLDNWLNPRRAPARREFLSLGLCKEALRVGRASLKNAIAEGQYEYPLGLFFGGKGPSTARRLLESHLARWLHGAKHVLHFDFHTGLGRWAGCKLLAEDSLDTQHRQWLHEHFARVAQLEDNHRIGYRARGSLGHWCHYSFEPVDYVYLCAEFGTYSPLRVLAGLRVENQAHHWCDPQATIAGHAKNRLKEMFCPADPWWRRTTVETGLSLFAAGLKALETAREPSRQKLRS